MVSVVMFALRATSTDCEGAIGSSVCRLTCGRGWQYEGATEVAASEREEGGDHARWFEHGWGSLGGLVGSLARSRAPLPTGI